MQRQRRVLMLVENLPSPFDRRVWQEAGALRDAGYGVSIVCPTGKGCEKKYEVIDDIHIWRYDLPKEGSGALGYLVEYSAALAFTFFLSLKVLWKRGFDIVHACNPPDLLFLIGVKIDYWRFHPLARDLSILGEGQHGGAVQTGPGPVINKLGQV